VSQPATPPINPPEKTPKTPTKTQKQTWHPSCFTHPLFAQANSGTLAGVEAHPIVVESHRANGLPGMAVIGLVRGAVKESAIRVRSAIIASGIKLSPQRLLVNFLPAELPKEAAGLDLALAASLLGSGEVIPPAALEGRRFFGELSLGGRVEPVRGALLLAELAWRRGDKQVLVPLENAAEAALVPQIEVIGVSHLREMVAYLKGESRIEPSRPAPPQQAPSVGCFAEVYGQTGAKRALEVAAAGGHNLLMVGPPGSGKSMLAQRFAGLLPPLSAEEAVEVTRMHAAAQREPRQHLITTAPFRAPHHSLSEAALCGGGSGIPRPGELSLAHRGVLFLDEFPEFSRRALESLREPLESQCIRIARAERSLQFPADVILLAAMNPCPCGYARLAPSAYGASNKRACTCMFSVLQRYRSKLSGPLLDRIDLHVLVDAVPYRDFARQGSGETTEQIRQRVLAARQRQRARQPAAGLNARLGTTELQRVAPLSDGCLRAIESATEHSGLSTRAISKIIRVARTLADLADEAVIGEEHVEEAIGFRVLDRLG
jgi:magnesium chelatase family protein